MFFLNDPSTSVTTDVIYCVTCILCKENNLHWRSREKNCRPLPFREHCGVEKQNASIQVNIPNHSTHNIISGFFLTPTKYRKPNKPWTNNNLSSRHPTYHHGINEHFWFLHQWYSLPPPYITTHNPQSLYSLCGRANPPNVFITKR